MKYLLEKKQFTYILFIVPLVLMNIYGFIKSDALITIGSERFSDLQLFIFIPGILIALGMTIILSGRINSDKWKSKILIVLELTAWFITIMLCLWTATALTNSGLWEKNLDKTVCMIFSIMMGMMSVYVSDCPYDGKFGIHMAWTKKSSENWKKTHELAGKFWCVCSLGMVLVSSFVANWQNLYIAFVILIIITPFLYCYIMNSSFEYKLRKEKQ